MLQLHRTHEFLTGEVRQVAQGWVVLHGDGNPGLDKDQIEALKYI